ncbi:MAG: cytochrome c biogenesis protein CcdA [Myxococcota bacterium]
MTATRSLTRGARALAGTTLALAFTLLFASPAEADVLGDLAGEFEGALASGNVAFALLVIFGAGLLTALTPCVYPMIAITVSVFGARQAKSRAEGAMLSLSFVLGIAAFFTPLGVISALSGAGIGELNGSLWVMGPLAFLFVAMALSMFGFWNMNLPPALQTKLASVGGQGYKGAFLVGLVSGVVAAPCTGPVIAVLLGYVASTRDAGFGALAFFIYSLGLGTLFFAVGTFAVSLPKSGKWMDGVKSVFGIVMLVMAVYYLKSFLPVPRPTVRSTEWLVVPGVLAIGGIFLGAVHLSFKEGSTLSRVRKGVGVLASTAGFLGLIFWMAALPEGAHIEWMTDYDEARTAAETSGKPLLVDFGADWCGACNEIEHEALSDPRVVAEAQRFVPVRVDLSRNEAERWALLKDNYDQQGLPFLAMHGPDGEVDHRITGLVTADEFLEMLRSTN